jgi:polyisoprenyl-teichoic acid--peptidoglycan teichoic acid transferase
MDLSMRASAAVGEEHRRGGRRRDGGSRAPSDGTRPWLLVATPRQQLLRIDLNGQPLRVGRAPGNGLVLIDQYASGSHAEFVPHAGGWAVRDLGSSNGTLVNGQPLTDGVLRPLTHGDALQIGESQLTFHAAIAPAAPPTPTPTPQPASPPGRAGVGRETARRTAQVLLRLELVLAIVAMLGGALLWLLAPGRVVVLVLGSDARPDELRRGVVGRTDTLLAVAADRQLNGLTMISIPRDLWTSIPGHGEERINAAYAFGGARTAERTVSDVLGVPVNRSVVIGLQGVRDVVDAAGGVEIDVPRAIHDDAYPTDDYGTMVLDIPAGRQWMDGETALRYARTRHQDNDFGRMARQQQVIAAVRARLLQPTNWWRLPAVLRAVRQATETNLGPLELATLGLVAASGDQPERLTLDLTLVEEVRGHDGAYLLRPRPALKERVGVVLGPGTADVEVLNASMTEGVARQAADTVRQRGLHVANVANAARPQSETTVEVCGGCRRAGLLVADVLRLPAEVVRESLTLPPGVDVRVTLGTVGR